MATVLIDSRDLNFTIDTYGTFTLDSEYEMEVDHYMSEDDTLTFDNFDDRYEANYDMNGYRKHLAEKSIEILERAFVDEGIVKSITLDDTSSPRFYNYTTDAYTATWEYDEDKLEAYCSGDRQKDFEQFIREHWQYEWDNAIKDGNTDTLAVIKLDSCTRNEYDEDDYIMQMFEQQNGYDYITFEPVKEVSNETATT